MCQNWVHTTCTKLKENDLVSWSGKGLDFICVKCAYKNMDYDAESALNQ